MERCEKFGKIPLEKMTATLYTFIEESEKTVERNTELVKRRLATQDELEEKIKDFVDTLNLHHCVLPPI